MKLLPDCRVPFALHTLPKRPPNASLSLFSAQKTNAFTEYECESLQHLGGVVPESISLALIARKFTISSPKPQGAGRDPFNHKILVTINSDSAAADTCTFVQTVRSPFKGMHAYLPSCRMRGARRGTVTMRWRISMQSRVAGGGAANR